MRIVFSKTAHNGDGHCVGVWLEGWKHAGNIRKFTGCSEWSLDADLEELCESAPEDVRYGEGYVHGHRSLAAAKRAVKAALTSIAS